MRYKILLESNTNPIIQSFFSCDMMKGWVWAENKLTGKYHYVIDISPVIEKRICEYPFSLQVYDSETKIKHKPSEFIIKNNQLILEF